MTDIETFIQQVKRTTSQEFSTRELIDLAALGIAGESGEIIDIIKKHFYHKKELNRDHLTDELGDLMWYVISLALTLDISFDDILTRNVEKLNRRYPSGFVEGGGIRE